MRSRMILLSTLAWGIDRSSSMVKAPLRHGNRHQEQVKGVRHESTLRLVLRWLRLCISVPNWQLKRTHKELTRTTKKTKVRLLDTIKNWLAIPFKGWYPGCIHRISPTLARPQTLKFQTSAGCYRCPQLWALPHSKSFYTNFIKHGSVGTPNHPNMQGSSQVTDQFLDLGDMKPTVLLLLHESSKTAEQRLLGSHLDTERCKTLLVYEGGMARLP